MLSGPAPTRSREGPSAPRCTRRANRRRQRSIIVDDNQITMQDAPDTAVKHAFSSSGASDAARSATRGSGFVACRWASTRKRSMSALAAARHALVTRAAWPPARMLAALTTPVGWREANAQEMLLGILQERFWGDFRAACRCFPRAWRIDDDELCVSERHGAERLSPGGVGLVRDGRHLYERRSRQMSAAPQQTPPGRFHICNVQGQGICGAKGASAAFQQPRLFPSPESLRGGW